MTILIYVRACGCVYLCRWYLVPRVLRDVSTVDLSVTVLGQRLNLPFCVAATAMQRMAHPDGETATARGNTLTHCLYLDIQKDVE